MCFVLQDRVGTFKENLVLSRSSTSPESSLLSSWLLISLVSLSTPVD